MALLDWFRSPPAPVQQASTDRRLLATEADDGWMGLDLNDPALAEWLRWGPSNDGTIGTPQEADRALLNPTVFRCVSLISSTIGALPLYMRRKDKATGKISDAVDHPAYHLLLNEPNSFQSGYDFRSLMQANALIQGNGYAVIVWSRGEPIRLIPLDPYRVKIIQNSDWTLTYRYRRPDGGYTDYPSDEILHLKGFSRDGINGVSRVVMAKEAISLAMHTQKAAIRLFTHGMMVGGVLSHPGKLSQPAHDRLVESLERRHAGAENAHKWLVLEENMDVKNSPSASTAQNSQQNETRAMQVEEIARVFDVPRPLLMVDETSWGSGIEQLGIFFVRYSLRSWFASWEQAIRRSLLTKRERREDTLFADFDERELLRGSLSDQAEYYAKALGAGGQQPWMKPNEVRDDVGLGADPDGDSLINPMTAQAAPSTGKPATGDQNAA
jgi:HK97 family phage portal protein